LVPKIRQEQRLSKMNDHRYRYVYLPLSRSADRLSGNGRVLLWIGKIIVALALLGLAIARSEFIEAIV